MFSNFLRHFTRVVERYFRNGLIHLNHKVKLVDVQKTITMGAGHVGIDLGHHCSGLLHCSQSTVDGGPQRTPAYTQGHDTAMREGTIAQRRNTVGKGTTEMTIFSHTVAVRRGNMDHGDI